MGSRRLRWSAVVGSVVALLALASCAAPLSGPVGTGTPVTASSVNGHVTGVVTWQSGSVAPTPVPMQATVTASPADASTNQSRSAQTAADGSYSLDLPPGTYDISASGGTPQTVIVTAGETAQVDIRFLYP